MHKMPSGFVVLGVASDSDSPESSFVIETLPSPLKVMVSENIETIIQQFLNTGLFMLCAPPPGGPECKWIPRVGRRPESCTDYFFSSWCLTQGAICEYQYQGFAGSYIEGQASARDNCVGCIADADCLVTGKVHASLVHVNIRPPCNWQRVNATSAPKFKGKVEISGSRGFGGDNAAIAAGVINVYVHGGSCQFAATALNGCQVGYQNPISINLGTGYDSTGGSINFSITLTWNGRNSDRCFAIGNGVCSEPPGASIRA